MAPVWTQDLSQFHGSSVVVVYMDGDYRVFAGMANGDINYYDFDDTGVNIGSGTIVSGWPLHSMCFGTADPDELYILKSEIVEPAQDAWQSDIYGTNVYRYEIGVGQDTNPFLFHTHMNGNLVRDGANDLSSTETVTQWGIRPAGGCAVCEIDGDTVLVAFGAQWYHRKSYNTYTISVLGFLYHRDSGVWELVFDNDEADYDFTTALWLDVWASSSAIDGRNIISWTRLPTMGTLRF